MQHVPDVRITANGAVVEDDRPDYIAIDEGWRRVINLEQAMAPTFDILAAAEHLGICPEGLHHSPEITEWIEAELIAGTYHIPPVPGSIDDMPARMFDAFLIINQTRSRCQLEQLERMRAKKKGGAR